MNSHAEIFGPSGFQRDVFSPEEIASSNDDLGGTIHMIMTSLNGQVGILSQHSHDFIAPVVLASAGMPGPASVLSAVDYAVMTRRANDLHGFAGYKNSENIDFAELMISDGEPGDEYIFLQMILSGDRNDKFVLSIGRRAGHGPYSQEERRLAVTLFSIFSSYFKVLQERDTEYDPLHNLISVFDLWHIGVMLIDQRGQIVYSNPAAGALLDEANGLQRIGNNLSASRLDDAARLQSAILFAIRSATEDKVKKGRPQVPVIAIARNGRQRPLILSIAPVAPANSRSDRAAVVAYIVDPDRDLHSSIEAICHTYGLTKVESQLVGNLVIGQTVLQAAQKMHIQPHTARSYLKQIFQKTMTNRQADLVRVILTSSLYPANRADLSVI